MLRKEIFHINDTQCTEGNYGDTLIKNYPEDLKKCWEIMLVSLVN